jgi:hypothetical protein
MKAVCAVSVIRLSCASRDARSQYHSVHLAHSSRLHHCQTVPIELGKSLLGAQSQHRWDTIRTSGSWSASVSPLAGSHGPISGQRAVSVAATRLTPVARMRVLMGQQSAQR